MRITKNVDHLDVGSLSSPTKTPDGFLRADAYVTRTGIFRYRNRDGSVRREYRPPDEVFKAESMETLRNLPVTDEHPPEMLTPDNAKEFSRGALGDIPRKDGSLLAINMLVTDGDLIGKMEAGRSRETSCGYRCDLELEPGVTPGGEHYDAIQRNIRYNHLAVLPKGRAGSSVSVRMDAAEMDVILDPPTPAGSWSSKLKTIRIDGIDFPADSDALVQAIARQEANHAASLKAAHSKFDEASTKLDAAEKALATLTTERDQLKKDAAELPAKLKKEMGERAELVGKARKVLGAKANLDGLTTKEVQLKVLARACPKAKMDGKSDAQIDARFDSEIERLDGKGSTEREDADTEETTDREDAEDREDDDGEERLDADEERKKFMKAGENAHKKLHGASIGDGLRGVVVTK